MSALSALPNPFVASVVLDAWSAPAVDVATIHQAPFQSCLRALESGSRGSPDSLLVFGPAGSGKTHLLTRLQRHFVETATNAPDGALRCVFVGVKLQTNAQLLWQHVRRRLAVDLLRKQQGLTQLQRLVAHRIAAEQRETPRAWVRAMRVLTRTEGESISEDLARVAEQIELGRGLCAILDHLVHERFRLDAAAWLAGDSVAESTLERLGLGPEEHEDREEAARQVVTALCRLAGETLPIVFCFDQIEALQQSSDDHESLFRFGRMAADLSESSPHVILISCVQSAFLELLNASVRDADRDRIFKRRAVLDPLTRAEIEALLIKRLDSIDALRDLRAERKGARFFPFSEAFLAKLASTSPCLPRRVLAAASAAFEHLQRDAPEAREAQAPEPRVIESFLLEVFTTRRARAIEHAKPEECLEALLHGLPLLWSLRGKTPPLRAAPGVDLALPSERGPIHVVICNETNLTSLAARLRNLLQAASKSPSTAQFVILRDARLGIPSTAKKSQEYLQKLEARGARMLKPSVEALAALDALRSLLSDARAGDLAERGETVNEATVSAWLAKNLDDALGDLVDAIEGAETEPSRQARLARDLGDLILRKFVVALDAAATELGCSTEESLAVARRHSEQICVLEGPPAVLFAYVPAESLGEAAE